jgi:hypothetical protein
VGVCRDLAFRAVSFSGIYLWFANVSWWAYHSQIKRDVRPIKEIKMEESLSEFAAKIQKHSRSELFDISLNIDREKYPDRFQLVVDRLNLLGKSNEINLDNKLGINLYSEKAMRFFSIFFTPIFGAFLMVSNLITLNEFKLKKQLLAYSIIYTLLTIIAINLILAQYKSQSLNNGLILVFNGIGFELMKHVYIGKVMPENYAKKSVLKPFIVSMAITIPFIILAILSKLNK